MKRIMGLFLALVMSIGFLPLNPIVSYANNTVSSDANGGVVNDNVNSNVNGDASGDASDSVILRGGGVDINATSFPDKNFRKYVTDNFDNNPKDGKLSQGELDKVTEIFVIFKGISNLKGIEYFKNLKKLDCSVNELTRLDVSKNTNLTKLKCDNNKLASLDVSHNAQLIELDCSGNKLTRLDVSKNTGLTELNCAGNKLGNLDVSNNTNLTKLACSSINLKSLDVSHNTGLTELNCSDNKLESLDVSYNTNLTKLNCYYNKLTSLDVSHNTNLIELYCAENVLASLDVSKNINLLDCSNNKLTRLDVSKNTGLTELNCSGNKLTRLDVSKNTQLTELSCGYNELTGLDVSKNTQLTKLNCDSNKLTRLDVSKNTQLTELSCGYNELTRLDVSHNTALTGLWCPCSGLTRLDVSHNTALTELECGGNELKELDLSHNTKLIYLRCSDAELTKLDLSKNTNLIGVVCERNPLTSIKLAKKEEYAHSAPSFYLRPVKYTVKVEKGSKIIPFSKLPEGFDKKRIKSSVKLEKDGFTWDGSPAPITFSYQLFENSTEVANSVDAEITVTAIEFDPVHVKKMEVTKQPTKRTYTEGENLDLTGLEVTLEDAKGVKKVVTPAEFEANGIKATPENGAELELANSGKKVKLTRGSLTAETSNALTVNERVFDPHNVKTMTVASQPSKLTYIEGDKLDLTGLVVTLTDDHGKTKEVKPADFTANDITATPENGTELKVADHNGKPVTLTRGSLTATTGALMVKAKESSSEHGESGGSGSSGGSSTGSSTGSGSGSGSSAGMNDDAPTTVDKGELTIQIDSAESDSKPGNAGDGADNANAGSAPEVKQAADALDDALAQAKRVAANPNATQAQVDAAARKLADARRALADASRQQHETAASKMQPKKRAGVIPKTGESASFAGLLAALGFSIAGLAVLCKKKMME